VCGSVNSGDWYLYTLSRILLDENGGDKARFQPQRGLKAAVADFSPKYETEGASRHLPAAIRADGPMAKTKAFQAFYPGSKANPFFPERRSRPYPKKGVY